VDQSVQDLKRAISTQAHESLNYTQMWEDELRSRFAAVNFIPLEPGQILRNGSLRVVRQMALGGLSAVYLCQLDEKRLVALKEAVVAEDATEAAQVKARAMLDKESELLLKLEHSGVVQVMDHFIEQGRNYLMLEYINGQDLRQLVRQNGAQRDSIVIEWAVQLASILKYLHEQEPPLIHRDFTPDNIVLREDGSLVVIDFGAANEFIGTATGTFVGKQSFIAPEQFRGKAVVQSDIYAFGCTLYFLLTGQEPEALSTSNPAEVNQYINKELCDVVVTCTQMEPQDRYQSAAQLLPLLKGLAASLPTLN
jgi:serine/threonine-protein kinase